MMKEQNLKVSLREQKRQLAKDEILDAAMELVNEMGFSSVRVEMISERLGLTKPALYYYFKSKEEIMFALVLREILAVAKLVEHAVTEAKDGASALEILLRTVFAHYRSNLPLFRLIYCNFPSNEMKAFLLKEHLEQIHPSNQMMFGRTEELLVRDQKNGRFPAHKNGRRFIFNAYMAVLGILNMKTLTEILGDALIHKDEELIDDLLDTLTNLFIQGEPNGPT